MLQQLRLLAAMLMGALVVLGVAAYAVLSAISDATELPPATVMLAQVAAGAAIHFFCEATGYRAPALAAGLPRDEAETASRLAFQSGMIKRFAFAEALALVSLAAAFAEFGGANFLGYVTGALVSLALMAVHVWPGERAVGRTMAALERDGARSYLREALGLA